MQEHVCDSGPVGDGPKVDLHRADEARAASGRSVDADVDERLDRAVGVDRQALQREALPGWDVDCVARFAPLVAATSCWNGSRAGWTVTVPPTLTVGVPVTDVGTGWSAPLATSTELGDGTAMTSRAPSRLPAIAAAAVHQQPSAGQSTERKFKVRCVHQCRRVGVARRGVATAEDRQPELPRSSRVTSERQPVPPTPLLRSMIERRRDPELDRGCVNQSMCGPR